MTMTMRDNETIRWAKDVRDQAKSKIQRLAHNVGGGYLHATENGRYPAEPAWWWTSGFWPGLLRLAFGEDGDDDIGTLTILAEDGLFDLLQREDFFELHHDLGFQFQPTAVMRFKQTGDRTARRRALVAAQLLMGRFNPDSGIIEAWNGPDSQGKSIIDTMMNLPLLFWATETTGHARFANVAKSHLKTAIPAFVRADHSTHHVIRFDEHSSAVVERLGGQGFSPQSAWSRGQAWAIYGLAIAARYTGDSTYRTLSRAIADSFIEMNASHGVPPWDFRADNAKTAVRDSSAAAIAACGLIELADAGDTVATAQAVSLLKALIEGCATFEDDSEDGLLRHATASVPANYGIDVSLIYGDYFFYEALNRLDGGTACW